MPTVSDTANSTYHPAESSPLAVQLNGASHVLTAPTIAAVFSALALPADAKHIAIAVNESVIARTQWDSVTLCEHDRIEVITAVAGG